MTTTITAMEIYANTKRVLEFSVTDADNGDAPLDLTGLTAEWTLARATARGYSGQATVLKDTTGGGITVTDAAGGRLEVTLQPADTQALLGEYHQELEIFDASARGVIVAVGKVTVLRNVSGA